VLVSGQTQPDGTRENPFTHAGKNRQREQGKYCKCRHCGNVEICTPRRDFWGGDGQPLLCDDCRGPYGENNLPVEMQS
jgi:hypothetical protein